MSAFQMFIKSRARIVKNGKSPLPLEVLRAFQAERRLRHERANTAVENGILKVIAGDNVKVKNVERGI